MGYSSWQHSYQQTLQRQYQERKAHNLDAARRADSHRAAMEQVAKISPAEHIKRIKAERLEAEQRKARQREEAQERERIKAERDQREFFDRLKNYRGPLDPILKILEIRCARPTKREIKACYLAAIRKHHPDAGGSIEMAQKVNAAYEYLMKEFGYQN